MLTQRYSALKTTETTETAPTPAAASAPGGVKKLNLAGFAKKKETGSTTEYPIFPDPTGKAAETAAAIRSLQEDFEALEGSLKAHKKFLIDLTAPFHFTHSHGKAEPAKAVVVEAGTRKEDGTLEMTGARVRVDFKHKYPVLEDESILVPVLGDAVGAYFRQKFTLTIDGDKLPTARTEELLGKLQELFADFNASDALTVKSGFAPVDDFHVKRHTAFTTEQNLELQKVCPIQAAVATKNVK